MSSKNFAVQFGKVRINTSINPRERILTSTSRISAFDCVLPFEVQNKGQILQAISTHFFTQTRDIIPNHFIGNLDAQTMLVRSGRVLPLEVIVRQTLSGSLWRSYRAGGPKDVQRTYGIDLPDGLTQHARFAQPIVTFTTKAAFGHDEVVTADAAIAHVCNWLQSDTRAHAASSTAAVPSTPPSSLNTQAVRQMVTDVQQAALKLFQHGQTFAQVAGLILLDTKYEFALDENNQLMLVDEIHTPDASRYADLDAFNAGCIEHLSKEWLREIIQNESAEFEKNASTAEKNMPFILRPFWRNPDFTATLSRGLTAQYNKLFSRLFPTRTPWDVVSPHLLPWPVDPTTLRTAESQQRIPSRVLVVGNGGRDYTLADFIERAAEVDVVYCWPGRDSWTGGKKAALTSLSAQQLMDFCQKEGIGWAVFGPEIPIAQGLAEKLREKNIPCLAPDLACARLESSKIFCKEILNRSGCPTAESWTVGWNELKMSGSRDNAHTKNAILNEYPYVLKYESLAAGKGVCLVFNETERTDAIAHFEDNLPSWMKELSTLAVETYSRTHGEPQFLVEKLIPGSEISAIALCNGEDFVLLPYAQDFKRRNDNQTGPNTGGMGSVCPVALPVDLDQQIHTIFKSTLKTLASEGTPYRGFLFAGLMIDTHNVAQVLEFNCRLGDPETQVVLPGLGRDLLLSMWLTSQRKDWQFNPWRNAAAPHALQHDGLKRCFVVLASPEYPHSSAPARTLSLPTEWPAGTAWIPSGVDASNTTSAGRMGGVLSTADSSKSATLGAYQVVRQIGFVAASVSPHFRTDIGFPSDTTMVP